MVLSVVSRIWTGFLILTLFLGLGWYAGRLMHFDWSRVWQSSYALGVNDMQRARFDLAQDSFRRSVNESPDNVEALYALAWATQARGQDDEALKMYSRVEPLAVQERKMATLALLYSNRGAIYLKRKNLLEAERSFRSALQANAKSADVHYQLGMILLEQNRAPEARSEFEKTLGLDSDFAAAKFQLDRIGVVKVIAKAGKVRRQPATKANRVKKPLKGSKRAKSISS